MANQFKRTIEEHQILYEYDDTNHILHKVRKLYVHEFNEFRLNTSA